MHFYSQTNTSKITGLTRRRSGRNGGGERQARNAMHEWKKKVRPREGGFEIMKRRGVKAFFLEGAQEIGNRGRKGPPRSILSG